MKSFFYGAGGLGDIWESIHPGVKASEAASKLPSVVRLYVFDHEPKKVLKLAKKIKTPHTLIRAGEILWSSSALRDTDKYTQTDAVYEYLWYVKNQEDCIEFMSDVSEKVLSPLGYSDNVATMLQDFERGKYHLSASESGLAISIHEFETC